MVKWIYCSALLNIIRGWLQVKLFWQNYYIFSEDSEWSLNTQCTIQYDLTLAVVFSKNNINVLLIYFIFNIHVNVNNANLFFFKLFVS